jgi:NACHT domain
MSTNLEADFKTAETFWQLEKLYLDLAKVKGKGLTPLEKKILQGLLCGYSPSEIAERIYHNRNSTSVRVYLSNSLYKYLQELLIRQNQPETRISHWSSITNLLERAGYQKVPSEIETSLDRGDNSTNMAVDRQSFFYQDWEEKIQIDSFIGRQVELTTLTDWIVNEDCRSIAICGTNGIGKSSLAVKLVGAVQTNFNYFFWRSLRQPPQLEQLLTDLIDSFKSNIKLPETTEGKISLLLDFFRSHRCLLVLDCVDRLFADRENAGTYREQYGDYERLLQRLCDEDRGGCCLFLSRQQPKEFAIFGSEKVRSFYLLGLSTTEAIQISNKKGLIGSESERERFVNFYANNPLIIDRASLTIIKIFNSNLTEFLGSNTFLLSNILEVLDEQFRCLTENERKILYALAVNQKLFQEGKFGKEFSYNISKHLQIEAIESLQRRSILLQNSRQLAYEPLLRIYIMEKLLQEVDATLANPDLSSIVRHLLSD